MMFAFYRHMTRGLNSNVVKGDDTVYDYVIAAQIVTLCYIISSRRKRAASCYSLFSFILLNFNKYPQCSITELYLI